MQIFSKLSQDQVPQVRKTVAVTLQEMIKLIPKVSEQEIVSIFNKLLQDEQDSVRMQGIDNAIQLAKALPVAQINALIVPFIKKFAEDQSWRIRYLVADRIGEISAAVGTDLAKDQFLGFFCSFLEDKESEVRTAACGKLSDFCLLLDS